MKHKNLDLSAELITKDKLATVKKLKADVPSVRVPLTKGQFILSTQLFNPNFCVFFQDD